MNYIFITYILIYVIIISYHATAAGIKNETCGPSFFDCGNNVCIPRSWRCDGDTDCLNGNDEKACDAYPSFRCDEKYFYKCREPLSSSQTTSVQWHFLSYLLPTKCIPLKMKCDGNFDCPGKDDEEPCQNKITCNAGLFKCMGFVSHATTCIPSSWVCDGETDCADSSDEMGCNNKYAEKCDINEFKCNDGQCIVKSWQCDGAFDCNDASDEGAEICGNQSCNEKTHFQCETSHFCLPLSKKCDGQRDCPDYSDEKNCTAVEVRHPISCSKNEFLCKNGAECIKNEWRCDGDIDCSDASDEKDCAEFERKCGIGEILCPDKICRESCEMRPHPIVSSCDQNNSYKCNDTTCIPLSRLCVLVYSEIKDCDKSVCDQNILRCDPSLSPYCNCRDTTQGGKICFCPEGFKRVGNSCIDVNECEQPGICDQKCINLVGSYKCECYPGFKLTMGTSSLSGKASKCRAIGDNPLLLFSNRASIRQYDLVTSKYHPLASKLDSTVAMDYWSRNRSLIWSDVSKKQILLCNMFNVSNVYECMDGQHQILIDKNIGRPEGLAVDWVHGLLFWTDSDLQTINVYDLVNNKHRILFNKNIEKPHAIAVDPAAGLIFWTDLGIQTIERAGMNGKDRVEVISGYAVQRPIALAVDIYAQRIYWVDSKRHAIFSSNYWGKDIRRILHSPSIFIHPSSLTVFEDRIYWADLEIFSANKFNGNDVKKVMNAIPGPTAVKIFHKAAQPDLINKCEMNRCDHLCLPKAYIRKSDAVNEGYYRDLPYSCECEDGFTLLDMTKCQPENDGTTHTVFAHSNSTSALDGNVNKVQFRYFNVPYPLLIILLISGLTIFAVLGAVNIYRRKRYTGFTALGADNPVFQKEMAKPGINLIHNKEQF